jgi:hypothetical protein
MNVGDKIKDNDPRMAGRTLTIVDAADPHYVKAAHAGRFFSILRRRIYTDGKPRRSGFSLVTPGYLPHEEGRT